MWQWLITFFFGERKPKQLPQPETPQVYGDLHSILKEAIAEVDRERQEELRKLMDDKKLTNFFRSTVKGIAEKAAKDKGTSFIGSYSCEVPDKSWPVFMDIFCNTCKEMGLPITHDAEHLRIEGSQVRNFFEKISPSPVDIDERTRALLRQGPYR